VAVAAAVAFGGTARIADRPLCSAGFVSGVVGGEAKCLRKGEYCSQAAQADYRRYGFSCVAGRLAVTASAPAGSAAVASPQHRAVGFTVRLARRTQSAHCTRGPLPDRACSPGAYYSGLTRAVICAPGFRTGSVRNVPEAEKHAVEIEYGMAAKPYGRTIEIDHIVPLELGGSNDIANLYPELAPGFRVKDALENTLHKLVCSGAITLHTAQRRIAADWTRLYQAVFGKAPATAGDMRRKKQ
jgi:hypothetical protein